MGDLPWGCNFGGPGIENADLCGFMQDEHDSAAFAVWNGGTITPDTGPPAKSHIKQGLVDKNNPCSPCESSLSHHTFTVISIFFYSKRISCTWKRRSTSRMTWRVSFHQLFRLNSSTARSVWASSLTCTANTSASSTFLTRTRTSCSVRLEVRHFYIIMFPLIPNTDSHIHSQFYFGYYFEVK